MFFFEGNDDDRKGLLFVGSKAKGVTFGFAVLFLVILGGLYENSWLSLVKIPNKLSIETDFQHISSKSLEVLYQTNYSIN